MALLTPNASKIPNLSLHDGQGIMIYITNDFNFFLLYVIVTQLSIGLYDKKFYFDFNNFQNIL